MGSALCCLSCLQPKDIDNRKNVGLKEKRGCTDIICFIFYLLTVIGFIGLAVISYFNGNFLGPVRDSKGIVCNSTGQVTSGKPYLYQENPDDYITSIFFQNHATSLNSICVEKCPNYEFNVVEINVGSENIAEHHDELICHDIDKFDETISNGQRFDDAIIAGECMKFIIPTIPFNNRCFPDVTKLGDTVEDIANGVANVSVTDWFNQSMSDVENSWQYIVAILGGAAFFAFVITLLMRWLSGVSVWFCITLFIAGVGSIVGFSATIVLDGSAFSNLPLSEVPMMQWDSQQRFWLYILISSSIGFFILILIIIGLRKRIRNSIQVMKMASRALSSTPGTVIFPILPFVFAIGSLLVFVIGFLSLHTMDVNMTADYLQWLSDYALLFKFIFIFVVIWMIGFIAGFQKVTLAGVYAEHYWTGNASLASGFWRALRYHMGSIAFGSFILACLRFIIVILTLLVKSKKLTKKMKKIASCVACIVGCMERIVSYVTDRTYIIVAIKGKGYCRSASTAMSMIIRNPINSMVLDKSAFFVLWVGRMIVMGASVSIGYFLFYVWNEELREVLVNKYVPLIIIAIGSLVVAHPFFLVISVAIDTTFFCFLEDCEVNDGSPEKPYANRYTQKYFGKRIRKLHAKHDKSNGTQSSSEVTEMR